MEHLKTITNELKWHTDSGKFEVTLTNGQITELSFCEPGKGAGDCGKCLTSTDYKFLHAVHHALGEMFSFMEKESASLNHKFANDVPDIRN
jgi:hypothetical protein